MYVEFFKEDSGFTSERLNEYWSSVSKKTISCHTNSRNSKGGIFMARKNNGKNNEKDLKTSEGNQAYPEYGNRESKGNRK